MLVIYSMDDVISLVKQCVSNRLGLDATDAQFGFIKNQAAVVLSVNEAIDDALFDDDEVGTTDQAPVVASKVAGETKPKQGRRKRRTRAEIEADEAKQATEASKSPEKVEAPKAETPDSKQPETKVEEETGVETKPEETATKEETTEETGNEVASDPEENPFAIDNDNAGEELDAGASAGSVTADPTPTTAAQNPFADDSESGDLFSEEEEVKPTTETSKEGFAKPAGETSTDSDDVLNLFA